MLQTNHDYLIIFRVAVVETSFVCESWSMEKKSRSADKSLIQVILQKYRDCSVDSITGPTAIRKYEPNRQRTWLNSMTDGASVKSKHEDVSSSKNLDGPPFSAIASARLPASGVAAPRTKPSRVKRTLLDGIPIACFHIGGEKRLCLGQLLADVLKEFSPSEVNNSRDHLKIYCPRCDEEQLESLKLSEVVPWSESSCLLITKSDAYRLCSALLSNRAPQRQEKKYTKPFLDVYHECFGGCEGIFEPETYNEPHAKCVTCLECQRMFSPRKFVTHSHASYEIQTCHWGMDSSKWRLYLLLPDDKADDEATKKLWEDVKKRFYGTVRKRKQSNSEGESTASGDLYGEGNNAKRRTSETKVLAYSNSPNVERRSGTPSSSVSSPREHNEVVNRRSAFRPWSPLEEKSRVDSASTSGESQTSTVSSSPSHMNSRSFFAPPHPLPFLARNCSCPVGYGSINGVNFVAHSTLVKPVKTEYPTVICTQGTSGSISHANSSRDVVHSREHSRNEASQDDESPVRETDGRDFASPERVKQVLHKYCHKGHLPSIDELSFALAKELREWSTGQARVLEDVKEKGERLREEMNSLRRENASKLDGACAELKCCQDKLEHLNRKREEDLKEFAKTREALQRQVESLQEQRSSDSETVKKLMNQLGERDTRCRLLEKELDYIRSWYIGSQRRYPAFQPLPVAVYGAPNLRDIYCSQSAVIQEIPIYQRNGESPALANRTNKSEDEDVSSDSTEPNTINAKETKPETKD